MLILFFILINAFFLEGYDHRIEGVGGRGVYFLHSTVIVSSLHHCYPYSPTEMTQVTKLGKNWPLSEPSYS